MTWVDEVVLEEGEHPARLYSLSRVEHGADGIPWC
jgi:hypothetical protein